MGAGVVKRSRKGRGRARSQPMAEINVTPFVDVMLVLLIIFMVTAPMLTQGLDVDLPQTKTVQNLPKESEHLVLTIKKDGSVFLDEYAVNLVDLKDQVKRLVVDQKKDLFMRADKEVPYGVVVAVMGVGGQAFLLHGSIENNKVTSRSSMSLNSHDIPRWRIGEAAKRSGIAAAALAVKCQQV